MPKKVDHDERRRAIVDVVWRLLATRGMSSVTMRSIAEEAGFANGVLAYYFAGKDQVLRVAYEHVFTATNSRIAARTGEARGLDALRTMVAEIMPVTEETLLEARIATALWQLALYDDEIRRINNDAWDEWRTRFVLHLADAMSDGTIEPLDVDVAADTLLTVLTGLQVTATLMPASMTPAHQWSVVEHSFPVLRQSISDGASSPTH